jgi:type I restriction enzyme S subunit
MRKMKDSGIEWIGEIPYQWSVKRIKNIGTARNGLTYTPNDVCNEGEGTLVLRSSNIRNGKISLDDTVYVSSMVPSKLKVRKGDILICSRNGSRELVGKNALINDVDATYGAFMMVFRCKCPNYMFYVLNSNVFAYYLGGFATSTINQLTGADFGNMKIAYCPDTNEQKKIADFLDEKCGEIDSIRSDIQKQIDILNDYKKSVITEAVTKGLNPKAKLKDSGIEWIGKIPEGWDVKRFKYIADALYKGNGITKEQVFLDGNTQCVRYGEIYSKYNISFSDCLSLTKCELISSPQYFEYGDILFAGTGELVEEIGKNIVYLGNEKCLAGGDIVVARHSQNPSFLNYALGSSYCQSQKSSGKAKLKVVHISATQIGNILVAVPPLPEQKAIADYLDEKCSAIDATIADKQKQLETLDEYKKSLIFEYVTGKKEVPQA